MASTSNSVSSSLLSSKLFLKTRIIKPNINKRIRTRIFAGDQRHNSGKLVDENLIILRMRIHDARMAEINPEPPTGWMEWEKELYPNYDSMICDAMALLQSSLMETRPIVALGIVVLIALSVPTSAAVIVFNLFELATKLKVF